MAFITPWVTVVMVLLWHPTWATKLPLKCSTQSSNFQCLSKPPYKAEFTITAALGTCLQLVLGIELGIGGIIEQRTKALSALHQKNDSAVIGLGHLAYTFYRQRVPIDQTYTFTFYKGIINE